MSILILNRIPYAKAPYDIWLEGCGQKLMVLTTPERAADCVNYDKIELFENYENNAAVEARALELYKEHRYDTVIAVSEYDILRAGKLRDSLGISGQSYESALAFRNKLRMKELVKAAGLPVPEYKALLDGVDLYRFVTQYGYPVVVKPVDGSGSEDTRILSNRKELMDYLSGGVKYGMEVEQFITGEMYHIDGLVIDGQVWMIWPSRYINGCLAFMQQSFNGSVLLGPENPMANRLISYTRQLLQALPTPAHTTFHAEVFHTPDDQLIFCEIASRTGGGLIRDCIRQGFGLDLSQAWVQSQCGLKSSVQLQTDEQGGPANPSGFLLLPVREGRLISLPTAYPEWVTYQLINGTPGQQLGSATSSVDTLASFLVQGASEREVTSRIQYLAQWLEQSVEWEVENISLV